MGNIGGEAGVVISEDGVPLASELMFKQDFLDLSRVEVLRGPQGTVAGRDSPGGAVNVYSNAPTTTPEGDLSISYGNFNRVIVMGDVSGPLIGDVLLGRLAVSYAKDDGWLKNTYNGQMANSLDRLHGRAYLEYKPEANFTATLIVSGVRDDSNEPAGVDGGQVRPGVPSLSEYLIGHPSFDPNNLTFQEDLPSNLHSFTTSAVLKLDWAINDASRLTSTTGYENFDREGFRDYDATPLPVYIPYLGINIQQISQEFTYTVNLGPRADLIAGVLYLHQNEREPYLLGEGTALPFGSIQFYPHQTLDSYGVYSQFRYNITNDLRLTVGARYTQDDKALNQTSVIFGSSAAAPTASGSWSAFTPRVALDYTLNREVTLYANVAEGFKSGGFNTYSSPTNSFLPETVWNYEGGVKSYLFDRHLRLNVDAFYEDYRNLQTEYFVESSNIAGTFAIENAGGAAIYGIELESEAKINESLRFTANATWLHARYTDLKTADPIYPELGVRNLAGNSLARSPDWQFNIGPVYTLPLGNEWKIDFRGDYAWQSKVYFAFYDYPLDAQGAYGLLNLSLALYSVDSTWRVTAFANNATNTIYWSNKLVGTGTAVPYVNGMIGEPRTFGVRVDRHF